VGAVSIGASTAYAYGPNASGLNAIVIGSSPSGIGGPSASGISSIAIGGGDSSFYGATASQNYAIAIGHYARATHTRSVALGDSSATSAADQIMMGTNHEVNIPGTIKIPTGAGVGKVLTSDVNGVGSWTTPAGGGSPDFEPLFWMGGF
jgi:hypothetical protein